MVRKSVGMTNAALAEKLGLSCRQVWRIEMGLDPVKSSTLLEISKAMGVNVLRFFEPNPLENPCRADTSCPCAGSDGERIDGK
jgi:transcriptional regulator with XRE-family HTH domain